MPTTPTDTAALSAQTIRILALDGGGIRGILSARLLQEIEQRTGKPATDLFHLIAGTSIGGITACGLLKGMSAKALGDLYAARGGEIFSHSLWHTVTTLDNLAGPKYAPTALETILKEQLGDTWLSQTRDTQVGTAPVLGLIAVRDRYDRTQAIAAGRCWQRLHLDATLNGVALQPVNQPIEMIDRERQTRKGDQWAKRIARLTGDEWQATFAFRAGFASRPAPPSPRRRLNDVVLE